MKINIGDMERHRAYLSSDLEAFVGDIATLFRRPISWPISWSIRWRTI